MTPMKEIIFIREVSLPKNLHHSAVLRVGERPTDVDKLCLYDDGTVKAWYKGREFIYTMPIARGLPMAWSDELETEFLKKSISDIEKRLGNLAQKLSLVTGPSRAEIQAETDELAERKATMEAVLKPPPPAPAPPPEPPPVAKTAVEPRRRFRAKVGSKK